MNWETVIGLETHVELSTATKLFCSCSTTFGAAPNTQCCPVCTGMPGALPVLNRRALEFGIKAAFALNCTVQSTVRFDRKNYFYPDLPKAYQISQLYHPIGVDGQLNIGEKTIRIHEMHLEEDAGKLIHDPASKRTGIDFNRCGVPLIEIVTEPDFRTGDEVVAYLEALKITLQYLGVSDCKMQEGSLRCDVNLSVRLKGSKTLGTRTEMKNLSSFRAVLKAVAFESRRQIEVLESGGRIVQETRRWDEAQEKSISMRGKENANDYRYFPEPDLVPVTLAPEYVAVLRADLPELPAARKARLMRAHGLSGYDAGMLTGQRALADFYEQTVALGASPKAAANWIMGEVLRALKERDLEAEELPLTPMALARLLDLVASGRINRTTAVAVFDAIFDTGEDPEEYVHIHGLEQVSDLELLTETVERVLTENPKSVSDYRAGKQKAFGFLVGQTMRALGGKANPQQVNALLRERLG